MERFTVFVSSTSRDLLAERKAVAAQLRKSEYPVTAMEDWDALPSDATTVSLDGVRKCDIFIGIYAFRYGFIPQGSTTSITQQEYEIARREGKRCLCYFKDEASATTVPLDPELVEPQEHKDLLAAFKERIEKELVRATFTKPEDLAATLAGDISRLERGYLPGYARSDLLRRWANRGIGLRNQLVQGALSGHTNLLPSPALRWWSRFITEKAWHEVLEKELRSITELAKELPELSALGKRAYDLAERLLLRDGSNVSDTYPTILTDLERAITENDIAATEALIHKLRKRVDDAQRPGAEPDPEADEKLYKARNLLRELRGIRESIKRPSFRKCFPVIGSLGSGRTHFIASLLGSTPDSAQDAVGEDQPWWENYNFLLLLLNQSSFKSLEETILDAINQACGLQWRTLEEFDRFLEGRSLPSDEHHRRIRCCIAIDDLQRWINNRNKLVNAGDELTHFVETHTHLSSFFWLFTLQDTSYSQMQSFNALLKNYSYFQTEAQPEITRDFRRQQQARENQPSHISGWLALDDLNRDEEFGLQLIQRGLELQDTSLPDLDLLRENQAVRRNLVKPFIATVLLDLHFAQTLNLQRLATLSYTGFVTEFWEKRKDEFIAEYNRLRSNDSQDVGYDDWSQALKLVAETLLKTGEFNPLQKDLENQAVAAAQQEGHPAPQEMVRAALAALTKSGFLKRYEAPDPEMPDYEVQKIGFEFEPFWQLRLANHIHSWKSFKQLNEAAAREDLITWFGVVEANEIEEGVLEFLLLLLDHDAANDTSKRNFVNFIQRSAIDSSELPEEAVWFSGVNATRESQAMLMGLAAQAKKEFEVRRLLHSVVYFLVESLPEISSSADRFKILQPHYADISRESLSAYFLYVCRRLLDQATDNVEVRRAMRYLSGSEVMGITEALASTTVNILFRKAKDHFGELTDQSLTSLVRTILDYLKGSNQEAKIEYERRVKRDGWERNFYREWVLRFFCSRLANEKGVDAYHLLANQYWYDPRRLNISWPVSVEMHREANFALGDWYRIRRYGEGGEHYLNLIRNLVFNGDFRDRETAFYLIRHSEATHGQRGFVVDDLFVPMLQEIFLDPKLAKTVSRFYDLFRFNLPDFRKLEDVREKKMSQSLRNRSTDRSARRGKSQRNKRSRN